MSFNSRTYSDCCLIVLDSPNSGHAHAEIKTVLRNQIKLYRNAPHGYYIGQDAQGNQYLFSFVSGNDIVKAFHDALVAQTAPKSPKITMSSTAVFNPVLMKTGQQSNNTNSNYHAFSTQPRMQPSRMAGPEEHTSFSTPSQYIRHSDINSLLPLQEINIRSSVSFQGCKAFYYLRAVSSSPPYQPNLMLSRQGVHSGDTL
ncbi:MAG: hypothetical protein NXY57DRAFT_1032991 [Lentinula lateritia]|nr:MAG: hypothetical protein NXY57DRAFT_1032991 [Lentinula lateritia]